MNNRACIEEVSHDTPCMSECAHMCSKWAHANETQRSTCGIVHVRVHGGKCTCRSMCAIGVTHVYQLKESRLSEWMIGHARMCEKNIYARVDICVCIRLQCQTMCDIHTMYWIAHVRQCLYVCESPHIYSDMPCMHSPLSCLYVSSPFLGTQMYAHTEGNVYAGMC